MRGNPLRLIFSALLLSAPCAWSQLPDAPTPQPKYDAFFTRPFGITAIISERDQGRQTKSAYTETTIGAGLSYRFLKYKAVLNINYGYSLQKQTQNISGSVSYRLWQFGKKRVTAP